MLESPLRRAGEACARRLMVISRREWQVEKLSLDDGSAEDWDKKLPWTEPVHGMTITMKGCALLFLYPPKTAVILGSRMAQAYQALDSLSNRDVSTLGEISNVMANTFAEELMSFLPQDKPVSPPYHAHEGVKDLVLGALKKLKDPAAIGRVGFITMACEDLSCSAAIVALLEKAAVEAMRQA